MSYVIAAPELVQMAAQDLVGIHGSVAEAAATASPFTTGIAAAAQDEISQAIASLFGSFGRGFQTVSAQAQAFHQQFVDLMSAGATSYAGAEAANVSLTGWNEFAAAVAAPYQVLGADTTNNLQAVETTVNTSPMPLLHQIIANQTGYAQTIRASIASGIQNLPSEVADLPTAIQGGAQQLSAFNPSPYLQAFANGQISSVQAVATGLSTTADDLGVGVQTSIPGFQNAFQNLLAGNNVAAYGDINTALVNGFFPGFTSTQLASPDTVVLYNISPTGPLGDLAPIFAIPGQTAQSFTNLLPAGSIPAQIAQHGTNLLSGLTNFGTTISISDTANITFGLPLQLVLDGIGAPANALSSLNSSSVAFASAVQTGNAAAAAAAVLDAPAFVADGFLNGSTVISLPPATVSLLGLALPSTTYIPLGGLLAPLSLPQVLVDLDGMSLPLELSGNTPVGGLIPGLLSVDSQLAQLITG